MTPTPTVRRIFLAIALALLLGLGWTGLRGGIHDLPQADTGSRDVQTIAQLAYSLLALLTAATTFTAQRWARATRGLWVLSVTLAGGLAPIVWGDASFAIGVLSGTAPLLIGLGIVWLMTVGAPGLPNKAGASLDQR
jgi:hypothetical protein